MLLHVGWRVFTSSLRPESAGEQDATATWLAVKGIEPLTDACMVRECIACLRVKQVLKLIQYDQSRLLSCIQGVEESHCQILWSETTKIQQGFTQGIKDGADKVGDSDGGVYPEPEGFSRKRTIAETALFFGMAMDEGGEG